MSLGERRPRLREGRWPEESLAHLSGLPHPMGARFEATGQ
jgi:hypothetical protein